MNQKAAAGVVSAEPRPHPITAMMSDRFTLVVVLLGVIYSALALTPSAYAIILRLMGAESTGLWLFKPQGLRGDEYAVWTPYIQAAVNNGFGRFNTTSIYNEDLRNFNGLPLLDWALPFKPQFWLFFLIEPARAFSFSHAVVYVAFLVGWHRLFLALGFPKAWSIPASILLLFTSYASMWWTTTGPLMALLPWLVLVAMSPRLPQPVRAALLAWLGTVWMLAHLYPPVLISLGFAGAVILLAYSPATFRSWRTLVACAVGGGAAAGLSVLYLWEPLQAMAQTVYPGQRQNAGGTVEWAIWTAQFFPHFAVSGYRNLTGYNVCEVATGGSYLTVLFLIFADHRTLFARLRADDEAGRRLRWRAAVLLAGFALMSLWMLAPIPAEAGRVLLWDRVPPIRMVFAAGVLLLLLMMELMRASGVVLNGHRVLHLVALVVIALLASKFGLEHGRARNLLAMDLLVIVPVMVVWALRARLAPSMMAAGLISSAAFANAVGFGPYNPVQSAVPIFERPETALTRAFTALQDAHPRDWLAVPGVPGAVLNGWGFRSVSHTLIAPKLEFFRSLFPEMPEQEFNFAFNRYAHVVLEDTEKPYSPLPDTVRIPIDRVASPLPAPKAEVLTSLDEKLPPGGFVDKATGNDVVKVSGWAMFSELNPSRRIILVASAPVEVLSIKSSLRSDVSSALKDSRLHFSGFSAEVRSLNDTEIDLCVLSDDPVFGRRLLVDAANPEACSGFRE